MTISEYIRNKVRLYVDDNSVAVILLDRGYSVDVNVNVTTFTEQQRELLYPDMLMILATSPESWGGSTIQHGGFTQRIGSEDLKSQDYYIQTAMQIYKKYDDSRYNSENGLKWVDNDY
jgi:hypothetical protein